MIVSATVTDLEGCPYSILAEDGEYMLVYTDSLQYVDGPFSSYDEAYESVDELIGESHQPEIDYLEAFHKYAHRANSRKLGNEIVYLWRNQTQKILDSFKKVYPDCRLYLDSIRVAGETFYVVRRK